MRMYTPTYAPHAATCYDGLAPTISGVRLHVDLELDITEHTELLAIRGIATTDDTHWPKPVNPTD